MFHIILIKIRLQSIKSPAEILLRFSDGVKCVKMCVKWKDGDTQSFSETDLHFVGIPSDSQGLIRSSGHGVILNHYHLHSCSLLEVSNQT